VETTGAGNYKLNVGLCVDAQSKSVGVGIVVCDAQCLVVVAMQQKLEACDSKLQIQAVVVLFAVQLALELGFRRLEVDIPYKELFHLLQADDMCLAPIGSLVDDIRLVKSSYSFCQFSFVKSLCNKAASALATEAVSSISPHVWLEDCPASIISIVHSESS
jgi:hypothetical protein